MKRTFRDPFRNKARKSKSPVSAQNRSNSTTLLYCEVLQGVKPIAYKELLHRFGKRVSLLPGDYPETIFLRYQGDIHELLRLRTIAAVMIEMTSPRPNDRFLNLMCGSGTLLIERLLRCPARVAIGCDIDTAALAAAQENLRASKLTAPVELLEMDATALQLPSSTFDVICADLPWGQLVGSHRHNSALYPKFLTEAARVATPRARLVLLTHEIKLFESVLQDCTEWTLREVVKIFKGGLHPRIYLFQKFR